MAGFLRPVGGSPWISNTYAQHVARGSVNPGVDYAVGTGTDVFAPEAGRVTNAEWSGSVGWWLGIDFDNGWGADLLHNSVLAVSAGQRVARGQRIAASGGTGSVATGPHLHWSLRPSHGRHLQNAGNVDGEQYLGEAGASPDREVGMFYSALTDGPQRAVSGVMAGFTYLQGEDGVFRPVGSLESVAIEGRGDFVARFNGSDIETMAAAFGIMQVTWAGLEPAFTGAVLRGPTFEPVAPPDTGGGDGGSPVDVLAVVAVVVTVLLLLGVVALLLLWAYWQNPDLVTGAIGLGGGTLGTALLASLAVAYRRRGRYPTHGRRGA